MTKPIKIDRVQFAFCPFCKDEVAFVLFDNMQVGIYNRDNGMNHSCKTIQIIKQ